MEGESLMMGRLFQGIREMIQFINMWTKNMLTVLQYHTEINYFVLWRWMKKCKSPVDTLYRRTELPGDSWSIPQSSQPISSLPGPELQMHRGKCGHRRPTVLQHHMDCDTTGGGGEREGGRQKWSWEWEKHQMNSFLFLGIFFFFFTRLFLFLLF